jgi:hypothetical protein
MQSERLQHRNNNFLRSFRMNKNDLFGDVIYSYTRAQAIDDGSLVDVSETTREAGIGLQVAVTWAVWDRYISWDDSDTDRQSYQDESGRLWDIAWMLRMAINSCRDEGAVLYRLHVIPRDGRSRKPALIQLNAVIHGGDEGEPVITLMLPTED